MQFPVMKSALRCFHSSKHLLPLLKPTHSLSREFPQFSRLQIHCTPSSSASELSPAIHPKPRVSMVYGLFMIPVTAGLVTKKTLKARRSSRGELPFLAAASVGDDLERDRVCGKLRSKSSGDLEKPHMKKKGSLGFGDIMGNKKKGKGNSVSWVCADVATGGEGQVGDVSIV
ncbi:hypothetical protein Patl1_34048 [Pistacia atlantica]|uniref:Uncharacterized protein n=1 Tax=Pistacia atlantica TaxID=434234 RepID=A0ACC0ZRJ4_9ROSI|nr:hypothetical protein Patl1_34048 [Pistacia atlantica]